MIDGEGKDAVLLNYQEVTTCVTYIAISIRDYIRPLVDLMQWVGGGSSQRGCI